VGAAHLRAGGGRTIDVPSLFIGGKSDWGVFQSPGVFETMRLPGRALGLLARRLLLFGSSSVTASAARTGRSRSSAARRRAAACLRLAAPGSDRAPRRNSTPDAPGDRPAKARPGWPGAIAFACARQIAAAANPHHALRR